jgi:hypothetical protein
VPLQVLPAGTAENPDRFGWFRELVAGLMVLARRRALRIVVMVDTAVTITSAAFLVVEPLYARHVVHRPPAQFALFEAAAGIGSMVAGLALSCIKAQPTGGKMLSISAACYGLAACLFIGITSVPVAYTPTAPQLSRRTRGLDQWHCRGDVRPRRLV